MTDDSQAINPYRPSDGEWLGAFGKKLRLQNEEWDATEVVRMEMGNQHGADRIEINVLLLQGNQRRCAAIDQEIGVFANHVKAGVKSTAAAKGIA